jgi:two-component system, cell cycle response regulator DivK
MANILLIEPDRVLAETYGQALLAIGHQVAIAPGAQSGILTADRFQPDLVILELQLVEHSGIEFLYEFRSYADWQSVPVIVQTQVPPGEFADSQQLLKNDLSVREYLYKPQTGLSDLLNAVNNYVPVKSL